MPEREQELQRFRQAVERKSEHAREAAASTGDTPAHAGEDDIQGHQAGLTERGRPQDTYDIRAKNAGKGKTTADKWNQ